jgi:glucosamine 6-phosphate synthetase-like amidotransferase/phosphosugar isomerase protein
MSLLRKFTINLPIPIIGVGCGVLGLSLQKISLDMGKYATKLLKALEYRGYDSTGAVFQAEDEKSITLLKDVGAPTTLVKTLGIENQQGKLFCGQVRWATFGTVTKKNAQPHIVSCKKHLYGAHNGNITNTQQLKDFLIAEGHKVLSDNDGEMLVHLVEHYFDNELHKHDNNKHLDLELRSECMRAAIIDASQRVVGSYAAVIVDPITEKTYAIKAGSSLYFGIGELDGNNFGLASSDLSAVLKFTKILVNLREGELIEFTADEFSVYAFKKLKIRRPNLPDLYIEAGEKIEKEPVFSKLRAEDTALKPPFKHFMEQEIYGEVDSTGKLAKFFAGGSNTGKRMLKFLKNESLYNDLKKLNQSILSQPTPDKQLEVFGEYQNSKPADNFYRKAKQNYPAIYNELVKENFEKKYFFSSEKNIFIDLVNSHFDKKRLLLAKALDTISEQLDVEEFEANINSFLKLIKKTTENGGTIYTVACGTSFHATKVASLFFNEIAKVNVIPTLPGDFRGQFSKSLRDHDLIIGVSQSGETKDLIDIFNDIEIQNKDIKFAVLVNNLNSTLGQEKSDVSIPILCGPEIAVPATKSFINQIMLFYYLAIKVAELNLQNMKKKKVGEKEYDNFKLELETRKKSVFDIPQIIKETIETTRDQIEFVAGKIYMEPSMHILATKISGVAKEGALKIRETVLNHAEGGEASEFKHGPNTILGKNTVFGIKNIKAIMKHYNHCLDLLNEKAEVRDISTSEQRLIANAICSYIFKKAYPFNLTKEGEKLFEEIIDEFDFFQNAYRNYPLLYVTGPETRDVNLTISQINTHKIRGADTFVIAEDNDDLINNARLNPHDTKYYGWGCISLPKTGDSLMTAFSATIVLQLLALRMSVKKMEYLDRLNILAHGVHPDVPKNVSKSITVD